MIPMWLIVTGVAGIGYMLFKGSDSSSGSSGSSSGGSSGGGGSTPSPTPSSTPSSSGGGAAPYNSMGSSDCPDVDLPPAVGGTDFDAMPAEFREVYEVPMLLTPEEFAGWGGSAKAEVIKANYDLAMRLAKQAACAGYSTAAQKLEQRANELLTW